MHNPFWGNLDNSLVYLYTTFHHSKVSATILESPINAFVGVVVKNVYKQLVYTCTNMFVVDDESEGLQYVCL